MRSPAMLRSLSNVLFALAPLTVLVACGDDTSGSGGGGGAGATTADTGATTAATTAAATTVATTAATTSATTVATSTSTGEGGGTCSTITLEELERGFNGVFMTGLASPNLGDADDDVGFIEFYFADLDGAPIWDGAPGDFDLSAGLDDNYATCARCVLLYEDLTDTSQGRTFFQSGGTLNLTNDSDVARGVGTVTVSGLVLVEVDIDDASFESTPVAGGECIFVEDFTFSYSVPDGWSCDPTYYDAEDGCDCACGAYDPDCDAPEQPVYNCEDAPETPNCSAEGECAAVPSTWTCDPALYSDGSVCNCDCGDGDSDCLLDDVTTDGCAADSSCTLIGTCEANETNCSDLIDDDGDGKYDCDDTTNCQGVDPSCVPGDGPLGAVCTANTDCAASDGDPVCLTEADFFLQDGQCAEWCDLANDDCPDGSVCASIGEPRGICLPTCQASDECRIDQDCVDIELDVMVCLAPTPPPPVEWICDPDFYGTNDGCDCGCGVRDPDCGGGSVALCEYCIEPSCAALGDESCDVDALVDGDNAICN